MKKIIFTSFILFSCLSVKYAEAQVQVGIGLNIGNQPAWGPVGYDNAGYYYLPDIGAYYDVNAHQYIYLASNNVWVHRGYLPPRYSNYNLYGGYKVVINDRDPWLRDNDYRTRYAGYRGRHDQQMIRDSRDARYSQHWRGGGENQRANNLNARARNENIRNRNQNQRDQNLNNRARAENQRGRQQNQRDQRERDKGRH
ncbi:MAG TPA: hypothetical protein VFE53_19930 [Mucilaginibacter sp.]|jgi:hypothetical protein|nr:hypothetical protein [Mucilaginibacter sp.]